MSRYLLILLVTLVIFYLIRSARKNRMGTDVAVESTEWQAALRKAQATIPLLRELHASGGPPILVKYALESSRGEREHVWGQLLRLDSQTFAATLDTPLLRGKPMSKPPYELALSALEDWQSFLPDGSIRGGFTTQTEIAIARRERRKLAPYVAAMEGHFVDH